MNSKGGPTVSAPFASYSLGPVRIAVGNGDLVMGSVDVAHGKIAGVREPANDCDYAPPEGAILAPGLIDLHTNGAADRHFNRDQAAAIETAAHAYARCGTTGFLATVMTAPFESMLFVASELAEAANALEELGHAPGARCLGIHFEGPFLNPRGRGVHRPDCLIPATPERVAAIFDATKGALVMITMAPEIEGVEDAVRFFRERGVVCSVGHTAARYAEGVRAIERGFRTVTHSFNAMPPLDHRDPSALLAFMLDPRTSPQVICDGMHVIPPIIRMLAQLTQDRLILATDNMPPISSGYYIRDGVVRAEDGTIAGSTLLPDGAVRNLMKFADLPFERAIIAATSAPARLIGLGHEIGEIRAGLRADFSLWSESHDILATIVGGKPAFGGGALTPSRTGRASRAQPA